MAREKLIALENMSAAEVVADDPAQQIPLFATAAPGSLVEHLAELDPDAMTPREAHEALYRLKEIIDKEGDG